MLKPDWKTAPSWAQYLAQDPNGGWWWFEVAPRPAYMGWVVSELGTGCKRATIPGEWRKSLTVRGVEQRVLSSAAGPDERSVFEAWIKKDGGDLSTFGSDRDIHYHNSAVNNAWSGWLARAALSAPGYYSGSAVQIDAAAKELTKRLDYPWDFMTEEGRESMRENVRCAFAAAQQKDPQ